METPSVGAGNDTAAGDLQSRRAAGCLRHGIDAALPSNRRPGYLRCLASLPVLHALGTSMGSLPASAHFHWTPNFKILHDQFLIFLQLRKQLTCLLNRYFSLVLGTLNLFQSHEIL